MVIYREHETWKNSREGGEKERKRKGMRERRSKEGRLRKFRGNRMREQEDLTSSTRHGKILNSLSVYDLEKWKKGWDLEKFENPT